MHIHTSHITLRTLINRLKAHIGSVFITLRFFITHFFSIFIQVKTIIITFLIIIKIYYAYLYIH